MEVKQGNKFLVKAEGYSTGYYIYPYDPKVSVFVPGQWEKQIPLTEVLKNERHNR